MKLGLVGQYKIGLGGSDKTGLDGPNKAELTRASIELGLEDI